MADRSIVVRLRANVDDYRKKMREAASATDAAASSIDRDGNKITTTAGRMVRSAEVNREAWDTSGRALTAFGTAGVVALGATAKAAIDWESAWAGVLKTVDGTPEQLATLEESLRSMALEIPVAATEIAEVAEAAGQLGVQTDNVAEFTRTMLMLGTATNMSATEAATSLARFMNVMGTAQSDSDRLGAAIVGLGNNYATTESEILDMAMRLAGAGAQINLSEGETLGLATALSSVGIAAEAGGSAMSKVMIDIAASVEEGGDRVQQFANIAGVSADEFSEKWRTDPAAALSMFIEGLANTEAQGGSTLGVLAELEITEVRMRDALLRAAGASDIFADAMAQGNDEVAANNALIDEAAKRYETTESQIQIAKNAINDAGIAIGENLLPMLVDLVGNIADVAQWFANLPAPLQKSIAGLTGVASVAALVAGGFLLIFPRVIETQRAFRTLAATSPRLASGLGKFAKGGAIVTAVVAGITLIGKATEGHTSKVTGMTLSVAESTRALLNMADAGGTLRGVFDFSDDVFGVTGNVNSLADAAQRISNPSAVDRINDFGGSVRGIFGMDEGTSRTKSIEQIETLGQALGSLVQSGEADRARQQFEMLAAEWEAGGGTIEELEELMPGYTDALAEAENQQRLATGSAAGLAHETEALADATEDYTATLEENIAIQREAAGVALDEWDALTKVAEATEKAMLAAENNGATLDESTQKGRDNRDALSDLANATWDWIDAGVAAGAGANELTDRMEESRASFITTAKQMGLTTKEAEDLADELNLIPRNVETTIKLTNYDGTYRSLSAIQGQLRAITGDHRLRLAMGTGGQGGLTYADGGEIRGPGTSTSDSIPIWASDGEFMHRAAAHRFWGTEHMHAVNNNDVYGVLRSLSAKGLAGGGEVSRSFGGSPASVNVTHSMGDLVARIDPADAELIVDGVVQAARRIARGEIANQSSRIGAGAR